MTDREMLELAAKAAGERVVASVAEMHGCTDESTIYHGVMLAGIQAPWSPLTDDGDALRLAVQCGILNLDDALFYGDRDIDYQTDPYAATRRAIVRAAAEIGRQMEETSND